MTVLRPGPIAVVLAVLTTPAKPPAKAVAMSAPVDVPRAMAVISFCLVSPLSMRFTLLSRMTFRLVLVGTLI